jgi:hypothetical protein
LKQPVRDLLSASGVDFTNRGGFNEIEQFQHYHSENKIIVYDGLNIGFFSVEIQFLKRNCTFFKILDTKMSLQSSRLPWQRGTYVTRVTHYVIKHTSIIKLVPCVRRINPVLQISPSIMEHASGGS